MRPLHMLAACAALTLAGAANAGQEGWAPATSGTGAFTIDTPCTAEEIAAFDQMPSVTDGVSFAPNSRILCKKGELLLVAGIFEPTDYPESAPALFDAFQEMIEHEESGGSIRAFDFQGRRALVNREESDGQVAQTQLIELDHSRLILILGGFDDAGADSAARHAMVDRIFDSVRINEQ